MAWSKTSQDIATHIASGVVPVSGTGARTTVFRFRTSATFATDGNQPYMFGWGTNTAGAAYRFRLDEADSYRFRLEVNSGFAKSTLTNLNDGAWHTIAVSNAASSNVNATTFYIDGSSSAISSSSSRSINTGTGENFRIGQENTTSPARDGMVCEYAEVAIYNRALDAEEMAMLTAGHITPAHIKRGRILYCPLVREYIDVDGLSSPSVAGSNYAISSHPRVIYPSAQILQFPPAAAGGGGNSIDPNGVTSNWNGLSSYSWNGV